MYLNRHGTRLDIGTSEDVQELDLVEAARKRQSRPPTATTVPTTMNMTASGNVRPSLSSPASSTPYAFMQPMGSGTNNNTSSALPVELRLPRGSTFAHHSSPAEDTAEVERRIGGNSTTTAATPSTVAPRGSTTLSADSQPTRPSATQISSFYASMMRPTGPTVGGGSSEGRFSTDVRAGRSAADSVAMEYGVPSPSTRLPGPRSPPGGRR